MATNSGILILSCFLILSSFTNSFVFPIAQAANVGFSLDFVHRDSPKSPFRSISLSSSSSASSRFDRLRRAFDRSISRVAYFQDALSTTTKPSTIQSRLTSAGGEYVVNISIGTPPFSIVAIADTGSDVTWTQCKPCKVCFEQDDPLFDPNKTSTYRQISCQASTCNALDRSSCDSKGRCKYHLGYGDGSVSNGDLASETFTFGSTSGRPVSIPKVVFGCGRENSGTFSNTSGIVGLGGGQLSIIKQLDKQIGGKFSYCLVPISSETHVSSKINFGSNAEIHDPSAVTTPLIKKTPDTFYFLNLENVSVGTKTLAFPQKTSAVDQVDGEGNIIIDSGTTLTILPAEFYQKLESTLRETIKAEPIKEPQSPFGLCYNAGDINISNMPEIVLHFTGADVKLPQTNTFLEVSEGVVCLTLVPADDIAILGNISQMNFLIEYDLVNEKLSFLPTDCTKQ